jgi:hypothetical protein
VAAEPDPACGARTCRTPRSRRSQPRTRMTGSPAHARPHIILGDLPVLHTEKSDWHLWPQSPRSCQGIAGMRRYTGGALSYSPAARACIAVHKTSCGFQVLLTSTAMQSSPCEKKQPAQEGCSGRAWPLQPMARK